MGYVCVVLCALALATCTVAAPSIADNSLDIGERVVLVAPVLAPPRDSRTHSNDRSRQFPILVLLAQPDVPGYARLEPEQRSLKGNPVPIYVQKLEDQDTSAPHNRQKRHLLKMLLGGHHKKGGYSGGYQQGGYPQGGGGCHGGCGGGGGGYSYSQSSSSASSSSYGGGKK